MISIICVYNNPETLESCLLKSLKMQTSQYDLCLVDNTQSTFDSASAALNFGAKNAGGEWLLFVHQDVILLGNDWLEKVEEILNKHQPTGWIGSAGVDIEDR